MRQLRVNELLRREIAEILHREFRDAAVRITITAVDVSPDLRNANVYYSVIGDETHQAAAAKFFSGRAKLLQGLVGRKVVLKYLPRFRFVPDDSIQRGNRIIEVLDEIAQELPEGPRRTPAKAASPAQRNDHHPDEELGEDVELEELKEDEDDDDDDRFDEGDDDDDGEDDFDEDDSALDDEDLEDDLEDSDEDHDKDDEDEEDGRNTTPKR